MQTKMTIPDDPEMELGAALKELEEHARTGSSIPDTSQLKKGAEGRQYLPAFEIKRRQAVFQPRTLKGQIGEEHAVMGELRDALKRTGVERMDPVIVWWSGKAFFCVDGHHRLAVIRELNNEKLLRARTIDTRDKARETQFPVPVTILSGSLSEAQAWSSRENGKARIMLKRSDRSDWAWKLAVLHWGSVLDGKFVMAQRYKDLHVSERLLKQMKEVYKKIDEIRPQQGEEAILKLAEMGWANARALAEGRAMAESWDDEKREAEIQKTANKLISALGVHSFRTTRAAITAEAILRVSERFLELAMGSPEVDEAVRLAAGLQDGMDPAYEGMEPDY